MFITLLQICQGKACIPGSGLRRWSFDSQRHSEVIQVGSRGGSVLPPETHFASIHLFWKVMLSSLPARHTAKSFGLEGAVQNATPELLGQGKLKCLSFPGPEHR